MLYELANGVVTKSKTQQLIETITDFAVEKKEQTIAQPEQPKKTDPIKEFWKKVK